MSSSDYELKTGMESSRPFTPSGIHPINFNRGSGFNGNYTIIEDVINGDLPQFPPWGVNGGGEMISSTPSSINGDLYRQSFNGVGSSHIPLDGVPYLPDGYSYFPRIQHHEGTNHPSMEELYDAYVKMNRLNSLALSNRESFREDSGLSTLVGAGGVSCNSAVEHFRDCEECKNYNASKVTVYWIVIFFLVVIIIFLLLKESKSL